MATSTTKLTHKFVFVWLAWFARASDNKDSQHQIGQLGQAGLGLPDRDYYFDEDKEEKRDLYRSHITKMFSLLSCDDAEAETDAASRVFEFEKVIATYHLTKTEKRDPERTYNPHASVADVQEKFAGLDWAGYFSVMFPSPSPGEAFEVGKINVSHTAALSGVCELISSTLDNPAKFEDLKLYLKWHLLSNNADYLNAELVNEDFEFYGKVSERSERALRKTSILAMDLPK